MSHREFEDRNGRVWEVWDVQPLGVEARINAERADGPSNSSLGAPRVGPRFALPRELREGWLAFQSSSGENRRLAPIPANWMAMSDDQLSSLVQSARTIERMRPRVGGDQQSMR